MKIRNKKITLIISILAIALFTSIYFNSPLKSNKNYPIVTGSFIQLDLTQNWSDSDWKKELTYLKQNKMKYLVISGVSQTDGNVTKISYKDSNTTYPKLYPNVDPVDLCLKNAEKLNMKVFMDTNYNNEWWQISPENSIWLNSQMERSSLIADDLYKNYHCKYPNAFYGWYFPYEVDNAKFNKFNKYDGLINAINVHLKTLSERKERLPILLSPFMNSSAGTAKEYESDWKYVFSKTNFRKGDIFCPQDCVGSGRLKLEEVNSWYTALRKAVDSKPGMLFWANAENFDYANNSSAPLDRFLKQLTLEQPCVDNIICFSYSHYYSPNNIDSGFNEAYSYYVKKGKLPIKKLDTPQNLTVSTIEKNKFEITWSSPKNSNNICGYEVYRNGTLISRIMTQRKYGGNPKSFTKVITDMPLLNEDTKHCTYEVRSLGFSGNVSKPSKPAVAAVDSIKKLPNLLSRNCTYTLLPMPHENYNDPMLKKLTDGKFASVNSVKDKAFVGWYTKPVDITIDLGSSKQVEQFMVSYFRDTISWSELPDRASIAVSEDGVNFTPVGLFRIPSIPFSDKYRSKYPLYLTLAKPINARYVKLTSVTKPNYYTFIDEFEVRSN